MINIISIKKWLQRDKNISRYNPIWPFDMIHRWPQSWSLLFSKDLRDRFHQNISLFEIDKINQRQYYLLLISSINSKIVFFLIPRKLKRLFIHIKNVERFEVRILRSPTENDVRELVPCKTLFQFRKRLAFVNTAYEFCEM